MHTHIWTLCYSSISGLLKLNKANDQDAHKLLGLLRIWQVFFKLHFDFLRWAHCLTLRIQEKKNRLKGRRASFRKLSIIILNPLYYSNSTRFKVPNFQVLNLVIEERIVFHWQYEIDRCNSMNCFFHFVFEPTNWTKQKRKHGSSKPIKWNSFFPFIFRMKNYALQLTLKLVHAIQSNNSKKIQNGFKSHLLLYYTILLGNWQKTLCVCVLYSVSSIIIETYR